MLVLFVILAFPACECSLSNEDLPSSQSDLLDAADEIITNNFKSSAATINFVVSLSDEAKRERSVLINNLVGRCDVVYVEDAASISQRHRLFNVIFVDDFKSFERLFERISSSTFVIDGYYLMIFVAGPIPEIDSITNRLWSLFIFNIDILFKDDDGLKLMTFVPFSETCSDGRCDKRCGDTQPVSIMGRRNAFPEKISNLYQCPVKVVTFNCPPMMMIQYDDDDRRKYDLHGIDGEMLKILSKILNFQIDLIHISDLIR